MSKRNRKNRAFLTISAAVASAFFGARLMAANTQNGVNNGSTDLTASGSYSGGTPTATSDVTFGNITYSPSAFTVNTGAITYGTLNDLDTPQTLSIANNGTAGNYTLTLSGGNNSVSVANGGNASDLIYVAGGNLTLTGNGTGGDLLGLAVGATGNFDVATGAVLNINSVISGSHAITQTGNGTVIFSAAGNGNTFSGTSYTLNAGTLDINTVKALGASNTFYINGGTIDNTTAGSITVGNAIPQTWNGNFTYLGTTNLNMSTGAVTMNGNITITTVANTLTEGGIISGSNDSITKLGNGTLALTGNNTFTGGLFIKSGNVSGGTVSGNFGNGAITIGDTSGSNNATLLGTANLIYANPITVQSGSSGNTLAIDGQTLSTTFGGNITLTNNLTVAAITSGKSLTLSGNISGSGNITVGSTNVNTVFISGANTAYTGNTTINAGTLNFANNSLGTTGNITFGGGILQYATGNTQDVSPRIGNTSSTVKIDTNDNTVTFASPLGNGLTGGLTVTSSTAGGVLVLSSANTYAGNTTLTSGTLKDGITNGVPSGVNLSVAAAGIFDLNGNSQTLGLASVSGGGFITNSGGGTPTLTIGAGSTGTGNFTGPMNLIWNEGGGANTTLSFVSITGNVTINQQGTASTAQITNLNNTGTFTSAGSGTSATNLTNVGGNITAITATSTSSALTVATSLNVNSVGTTLINSQGTKVLTVTPSVAGTGNLTLDNNGTLASGITLTGGGNFTGNLTNAGTSSGSVTVTGALGTNVLGVTQTSPTSTLAINGANLFAGNLTIINGNVSSSSNTTPFGSGAGSIVLGNTSAGNSNPAELLYTGNSTTVANPIIVNAGSSGTLSIDGQTNTNAFTGNIALNNNLTLTQLTLAKTTTFSGQITGSGNLTVGTGGAATSVVAISGSNSASYTGNTTIAAGILNFANGALGTGGITFSGSSTLQWAVGNTQDVTSQFQPLTGATVATLSLQSNALVFGASNCLVGASTSGYTVTATTGNLTLNAANNYPGTFTTNAAGSTIIGNSSALGNATVSIGANNALTFTTGLGNASFGGLSGTGSLALTDGANAVNLTVGGNNGNTTYTGVLTGNGSLTKIGTGTFTLNGIPGIIGGIYILNGTLTTTNNNSPYGNNTNPIFLGDVSGNNSATLSFGNTNGTTAYSASITVDAGSTGTLTITANNSVTEYAPITLANNVTLISNNTVAGKNLTLPGGITETGSTPLTITVLNNTSTQSTAGVVESGTVTVSSGGLTLLNASNGGIFNLTNATTAVNGSGNLTIDNNTTNAGGMTLGAGTVNNTGTVTNNGTGAGTVTISGALGANVTGVFQNSATSQLTLSGASSSYAGNLTINAGIADVTSTNLGTGSIILGASSGSANAALEIHTNVMPSNIIVAAGSTGVLTVGNDGGSGGEFTGTLTLNNNVDLKEIGTGYNFIYKNNIIGSANITTDAASGGSVILWAHNTGFTGNVTVNTGTLKPDSLQILMAANSLAVNSGATFDINNIPEVIPGLNNVAGVAGTVTNSGATAGTALTLTGNGTYSFAGVITATTPANLALVVSLAGNGTQTLTGSNTYAGGTTINSGTLALSGSGTLGATTGALTMAGGTLDLGGGNATVGAVSITALAANGNTIQNGSLTATGFDATGLTFGTAMVTANLNLGSSTVNLNGPVTLTLAGNTSYTGATTVSGSTLNIGGTTASVSTGALTLGGIYGGGVLNYTTAGNVTQSFASTTISGGASAILTNNGNFSLALGAITRGGDTVDFTLPTGGTGNFTTTSTTLVANSILVSATTNGVAFATANGGQYWATNSSGTIGALAAGVTGNSSYNTATNNIDVSDGDAPTANFTVNTLRFNSSAAISLTLAGSNTINTGGILVTPGTNATMSGGNITSSAGANELVVIDYGTLNIGSVIADNTANAVALTTAGTGTTALTAANTYTGITTVNSGTLALSGSGALGTGALQLYGGAVNLGNTSQSVAAVTIYAAASGSYTLGNGNLTASSLTASNVGGNVIISANLSLGNGTVTETGAAAESGTLTLTGNNTYTGSTTINDGTLNIQSNGALGNSASVTTNSGLSNGSVLQIQSQGANNITLAMPLILVGFGPLGAAAGGGTLENVSGNNTCSGLISVSNTAGIRSDSGTLYLTNTGSMTPAYGLTFSGAGNGTFAEAVSVPATAYYIVTVNSTGTWTLSGVLSNSASAKGVIVNSGTLILTGNSTYNGVTAVNGGTLQLGTGGSLGNTSVTVSPGATFLASAGTAVNNAGTATTFTLSGGSSAPNLSLADGTIGSFTIGGNLSLATGTVKPNLTFDIGNTAADQLLVNGLSFGGGSNTIALNPVVGTVSLAAGNYTLITSATTTNTPADWTLASGNLTVNSVLYTLSLSGNTTAEILTVTSSYRGPFTWTGAGNNSWDTASVNWMTTGGSVYSNGINVVFDDTGSITNPVNITASGVTPASLTFNNSAKTYAFTGGQIAGASTTLTLNGNGTVILENGANTFGGNTSINAGTLQLGNGTSGYDASLAGNITNNAALVFNLYGNQNYAGVIGGNGTVTVASGAALTLTGANTYSGGTTVNAGMLEIATATNGLLSGSNVYNYSWLQFDGTQTLGAISGNGNTAVSPTGNLTVANFVQPYLVNNGTFILNSAGTINNAVNGNGSMVVGAAATLTVNDFGQASLTNFGTTNINGNGGVGLLTGNGTVTIGGSGSFTVGNFTQPDVVNNGSFTLNFTGAVTDAVSGNGSMVVRGLASLTANNFSQASLANFGTTNINGNGTIGQLTGFGSLFIGNGSLANTVTLAAATTPGVLGGLKPTQGLVTIASGSTLDITNNAFRLNYGNSTSPLAAVANAVAYGAGKAGNASSNGAIISSTVNTSAAGKYAVGYADHTEISSIPTGNVEVAYTLAGDANLDGSVDILDYQQMAPHYDEAGTYDWSQGDFNHDGHVDILDYQAMAPNYDTKLTAGTLLGADSLTASASLTAADLAKPIGGAVAAAELQTSEPSVTSDTNPTDITAAIPEPASLSLLLLGGIPLLGRRRRRRS